jgi:prolipoprotein diacylglyceryltransferase
MLPILQIGSFSLRTPGLALLAGLWLGLEVASREGERQGISGDRIYNLGFAAAIAGLLGARLGFVMLNLLLYTRITPWTRALGSVFSPSPGTEVAWLGVICAAGAVATLIWRWKLLPVALADSFAPGAAIFFAGISLSNLLSGEAYGVETNLPWAIPLWGARRHPTQVYMLLAAGAALAVTLRFRSTPARRGKRSGKARLHERAAGAVNRVSPGFTAQALLMVISVAILLFEPLRADSPVVGPGIRVWSVIALVTLVVMLAVFAYRAPAPRPRVE